MDFGMTTLYIIVSILALIIYLSKKGLFLKMLRDNIDVYGTRHSWKKTIMGLVVFLLSVPAIIFLALYAAKVRMENLFVLISLIFFIVVMILQIKKMSKDNKNKKRLWEEGDST